MKVNFLVSGEQKLWLIHSKKITVGDPYIHHILLNQGRTTSYDEINVIPGRRNNRKEFENEANYIHDKHEKLRAIFIDRLRIIHGEEYSIKFWQKIIALSLLRHLKFCYDLFYLCEDNFDATKHIVKNLSVESYQVPVDFNQHREYYQHSDLAQEQLFSIYCNKFYPGIFQTVDIENHNRTDFAVENSKPNQSILKNIYQKIGNKFNQLSKPKWYIKRILCLLQKYVAPTVLIFDCSFEAEHIFDLELKSLGRIVKKELPQLLSNDTSIDYSKRQLISADADNCDKFDNFVLATLNYATPLNILEGFNNSFQQINSFFDRFPKLRWVVAEWWIGNSTTAFFLGVGAHRNIKHLYPEHNYIAHIFLGNNLRYIYPLVDSFVSLGWENDRVNNHTSGGSLYPWKHADTNTNKILINKNDILFISSLPLVRAPEINCSYGEADASRVLWYLEMNSQFFDILNNEVISKIVYLPYPKSFAAKALTWDQDLLFSKYIRKFRMEVTDGSPAKLLMKQAGLVVVNYLSTAYLEALVLNIPVIVLWNSGSMLLNSEHQNVFDDLISVGVFHVDPGSAARFLNLHHADPQKWWRSERVQTARRHFLDKHLGEPKVLKKIILHKAKSKST
jgi:putative transferase (TIGR04331 family)